MARAGAVASRMKIAANDTAAMPITSHPTWRRDMAPFCGPPRRPAAGRVRRDGETLPAILAAVARTTVFGAGAMGTAVAMHLARAGNDTILWASEHDRRVLPDLIDGRKHPALPEFLPDALKVMGP